MLSDKYTIYGDFEINDNLCEYFNCKNIVFDFITSEDDNVPLIDKILYQSDKNKKILLILGISTIRNLYQQVSKYNNFLKLIDDGRTHHASAFSTSSCRPRETGVSAFGQDQPPIKQALQVNRVRSRLSKNWPTRHLPKRL